jgi:hypothetical protein
MLQLPVNLVGREAAQWADDDRNLLAYFGISIMRWRWQKFQ